MNPRQPRQLATLVRQAFGQLEYLMSPEQRLDMTRVYRDARERSFAPPGPETAAAQREADAEFIDKAQT